MRTTFAACLVLSLAPLGSCSLFASSTQGVTITASDPNAEIYVDGNYLGKGATSTALRRNRSHTVMAKCGDRVGSTVIGTSISATGVLDLIGGFLFLLPFIGVAGPGFMQLDADAVTVIVPPAAEKG